MPLDGNKLLVRMAGSPGKGGGEGGGEEEGEKGQGGGRTMTDLRVSLKLFCRSISD